MEIHDGRADFPWGEWKVAPAFTDYVKFLQNAASSLDPFYTVIANGPCSLLWTRIGRLILPHIKDDNPYAKFARESFGEWNWGAIDIVKREMKKTFYLNQKYWLIEIFKLGLEHEKQCFLKSLD